MALGEELQYSAVTSSVSHVMSESLTRFAHNLLTLSTRQYSTWSQFTIQTGTRGVAL